MSYTRPLSGEAGVSWLGASVYTRPAFDEAGASFLPPPSPDPTVCYVAAPSPLSAVALLARSIVNSAQMAAPSPLGSPAVLALHDFTGVLGDATTHYVMDLVTPGGTVRVPISSWQATLQTGGSNYVQCVVPACAPWVASINTATEFVISRSATTGGVTLEYEMARAPAQTAQFDRGPNKYTCTLSGYSTAFAEDLDPPAVYDRTLSGIRSISNGASNMRVRCAVDWLLRPGHRAYADGAPLVVSYINYYAPTGSDSYMDVGT
jgi:hypothetical protein